MSGGVAPDKGKTGVGEAVTSPNASHGSEAQYSMARSQANAKPDKAQVRVRRLDNGLVQIVKGRSAQTLLFLHGRRAIGATSGEFSLMGWGRRTSAYVFNLRAKGFDIETRYEQIGDAQVGRYILRTALEVLSVKVGAPC